MDSGYAEDLGSHYKETAVFGELTYAINPGLRATAGARRVLTFGLDGDADVDARAGDLLVARAARQPAVIRVARNVEEHMALRDISVARGKQALDAMNPLCTLRYSATHVNKHHMVYRLDAVDAYERRLVKQIEVASATNARPGSAHNLQFIVTGMASNTR